MAVRHPLPYAFAKAHHLLLEDDGQQLTLWADAQAAVPALSEVLRHFQVDRFEHEPQASLAQRIATAYAGGESSAAAVVGEVESAVDLSRMMQDLPAVEDLLEAANDAPIIRMLNALLTQAAKDGASDIHIEPYERSSSVRFRVDGTLREVVQPNKALHAALISRLKIMAELDIAEKRLPQDGRISLRIGGRGVDVRVSTLPSAHGERAVLRLLDKGDTRFTLESLGMGGDTLARFARLIDQPHGIVLVTGPTGSGKTTTLYAALGRIDTSTTNVLTVEDPIEYELPGIGQTQVNAKIDLTFAKALRAILRQDPDVIMIGEIRDFETAQIAIQASLTGHLVLATLHTNDAPSAVTRLIDMGIEPFLLSSSLLGVLAQRLVRKLCPHCKRPEAGAGPVAGPPQDRASPLAGGRSDEGASLGAVRYHPVGCKECGMTGYKGRTGVYELMVADDKVRALIHNRAAESQLFVAAEQGGLRTMREDGERLVQAGITSLEEVLRVTRD
ncbi:type II secretion system ATPase GspE [Caldimonas sp.]